MMSKAQELLTLPLFLVWVKEQHPSKVFTYTDIRHCSIAQYLTAQGLDKVNAGVSIVDVGYPTCECLEIPKDIQKVMEDMFGDDNASVSATFGALAVQLEKVNAQASI